MGNGEATKYDYDKFTEEFITELKQREKERQRKEREREIEKAVKEHLEKQADKNRITELEKELKYYNRVCDILFFAVTVAVMAIILLIALR